MKPNELKLWHLNIRLAVVSSNSKSIDEVIELIYLEGRKAQVKVDAEIAKGMENEFWDDGQYQTTDAGIKIAKAIEGQDL